MTVKANGQVDQEPHLEHRCASTISRPEPCHGRDRRDDSIADNVGTTRSQSGGPAEARKQQPGVGEPDTPGWLPPPLVWGNR